MSEDKVRLEQQERELLHVIGETLEANNVVTKQHQERLDRLENGMWRVGTAFIILWVVTMIVMVVN